jgi:hypothetical protein
MGNMNAAHLHLAINHLPVIGLLFALGVLAVGRVLRSEATMRVGLWLLLASGVLAIPAYLSGEPAEEIVERLSGISKALIEKHEDAAAVSFALTLVVGGFAAFGLFLARSGRPLPQLAFIIVAIGTVVAAGSMAWTAKLGGEIHHPEIRSK